MGHIAKENQRNASAAIEGSLETMHETTIAIPNNHEGVNTTTRPQSTRVIKYDTSDDRAKKKEKKLPAYFLLTAYLL